MSGPFDEFLARCASDCVNAVGSTAAHEAGLAEEARATGGDPLGRLSCPDCGRPVRHLGYEGRCDRCAGVEEEEDRARQREGRRRLHRDTAELLRRIGQPERAAWHDSEAERWRP